MVLFLSWILSQLVMITGVCFMLGSFVWGVEGGRRIYLVLGSSFVVFGSFCVIARQIFGAETALMLVGLFITCTAIGYLVRHLRRKWLKEDVEEAI